MVEITRVGSEVASLGECPVWSDDDQRLYWEDIDGKVIHRTDPITEVTETRELPGRPGSFVLTQTPGRLLVAMETSLVWFDWEAGNVSRFLDVGDVERGNRFNDGRCDSAGRYVVGTMHPDDAARRFDGSLYSIDATGNVDILETDVGIPNSTVFDAARGRMYWADTFHATIWQWDYDIETGRRSNRSVFFDYNAEPGARGVPDGACLDIDGCVWSASVHGWALTRITPDGAIDRVVELPVAMPTMPAFGGPDLGTIYVTSINGGQIDGSRSAGIPAGALLAVDAGVQGLLEPPFAG